jgi:hypothetical protein
VTWQKHHHDSMELLVGFAGQAGMFHEEKKRGRQQSTSKWCSFALSVRSLAAAMIVQSEIG